MSSLSQAARAYAAHALGLDEDRTALCNVASTGAGCTSPTIPKAAPATANAANAFLTKALSPSSAVHHYAATNQPTK